MMHCKHFGQIPKHPFQIWKKILEEILSQFDFLSVIRSGDYFMFEGDSDDEIDTSSGADIINLGQDDDKLSEKVGPLQVSVK